MSRWRPKGSKSRAAREYSIARALASFSPEEEAALCAFLAEMEKARLAGDLVLGWRITRDQLACGYEVMYLGGELAHSRAPTFREAGKQLSREMVNAAMKGAPQA